ncbi:MAG TPA: glycoside hydrolase family 2 TIM barrel-domain containing protein [Pyrinomonadaceae bacterium]|jgi:mannan endo-1,4-beta-mannosidase
MPKNPTRRLIWPLTLVCLILFSFGSAPSALAAPGTFTISANKHYWLKDGVPFITIGYNRYDVWNSTDTANDGLSVTAYVQRMAQNGVNVIRVWAEQGDQNASGDYWLEYPAGAYRLAQQARLDELFNACDAYGVYVEICPWDTYNVKNNWAAHAYNAANGGPCNTPAEVITNQNARALIKSKIQYIYSRWGNHPSFFLWTFNEIDILNTNSAAQQSFAQDIGTFIKSIDPYHPFTVSYTGTGAGNPAVEQLSVIGAADIHFYGAISGTGGVAKENETAVTRDGGYMNFGKPLVLSEWGQTRNANSDDLVNALAWGGIGIGASGAGMVWTDKYQYGGITANQLAIFKALRNFTNTVNWSAFMDNHHASATEVTDTASAVNTYACLNKSQAVILLVHNRVGSSTATTVTVSGLNPGTYTVDIWRTYTGGKYGSITATTNAQGQLVISAPAIPTMQALYIH